VDADGAKPCWGWKSTKLSARNNKPPALESRPANNPEPKPPIIATPPTCIHPTRAFASPALYTDLLNCTPSLIKPLGATALLDITRRASLTAPFRTHWPTNWIDRENCHRAIWLLLRARRKMLGRARATPLGAGEGRETNTSTWARSAGELEELRKCALKEIGRTRLTLG
jgi:hypothetical protein